MYHLKDKMKKLNHLDIVLMKASLVFIVFFLLKIIPSLMGWVQATNKWILLLIAVILTARPCYKMHKKK